MYRQTGSYIIRQEITEIHQINSNVLPSSPHTLITYLLKIIITESDKGIHEANEREGGRDC